MNKKTYDTLKEIFLVCAIIGAILVDLTAVVQNPALITAGAILTTIGGAGCKYLAEKSKEYFSDKLIVGPDDAIEGE